jgi:universal stress protein E
MMGTGEHRMNRIAHIVVIVDPSQPGRQVAVDKAAVLSRCLNASIELLICDSDSNTQQLDLLEALAAPLRAQGTEITLRTIQGASLHDTLLDYLRASDAGLVVKDTHHHSLVKRTFLRNTDWHLTRGCPVPLLLTKKRPWGQPRVIMAAVDPAQANDSAASLDRDILHSAASLAVRLAGDLHVIHTFIPAAFAAAVAAGGSAMSAEYSQALQAENSYRFFQIERLVAGLGVNRGHLHIEMGTPEDCLARIVVEHHTDLMVMGASSHGRWHRMVVGSTVSTILESLPCDILIVKPCDDAQTVPF